MEFPRLVFVSPGKNVCNGGTYGCELVKDEDEYDAALNAGFYQSIPDALAGSKKEKDDAVKSEEPIATNEVSEVQSPTKKRGRPGKE